MRRPVFVSLVWLALSACLAAGAPARLPNGPEKPPDPPPALLDLRGTTWQGECFSIPCRITLEPDGTLTYRTHKDDTNTSPGVWRQTGNQLVFEINQYSEHRGIITGNIVQGDSSNKGGMRGKFQLQRVPPSQ
jgi:hypothetical protein